MKLLHLFGKSITLPVHHVRQPAAPSTPLAGDTVRKIDAIESEIIAELDAGTTSQTAHTEPAAQLAQHIDEASLLFASRQPQAAETLLLEAVAHPSGCAREPIAWMMLLELASVADDPLQFEELALRYAQRFETSPPQWRGHLPMAPVATPAALPPGLKFRGKLLGSSAPALGRFEQMAQAHTYFRVDLGGVTEVDSEGCGLLLKLLERLLAESRRVELMPAPALVALLRTQLDSTSTAHRDDAWRLLIELLRIAGDSSAHEEACIAYSIAHEVSPPAPLLPQAAPRMPAAAANPDTLPLPAEISFPVDTLLKSLREPAAQLPVITLDCRALQRIEFNAAAPLLAGLVRLADGKPVEWRDISHLVSTLLQLIGGAERLRIVNRKP